MTEVTCNTVTPAKEYSKHEINCEYLFNSFNTLFMTATQCIYRGLCSGYSVIHKPQDNRNNSNLLKDSVQLQIINIYTTDCLRNATKQSKETRENRVGNHNMSSQEPITKTINDTPNILHPSVTYYYCSVLLLSMFV